MLKRRVEALEEQGGTDSRMGYFRGLAKIVGDDDPEGLAAAFPDYVRCHDSMVLYLAELEERER